MIIHLALGMKDTSRSQYSRRCIHSSTFEGKQLLRLSSPRMSLRRAADGDFGNIPVHDNCRVELYITTH